MSVPRTAPNSGNGLSSRTQSGWGRLINKTCSCGRIHRLIPESAKFFNKGCAMDGHYWECVCKSTLFVPLNPLMEAV